MSATATATLSDRQRAFILAMLAEVLSAESNPAEAAETVLAANIAAGRFATRAQTSEMIDALIAKRDAARAARRSAVRPVAGAARPAVVEVEAGYYAVEFEGVLRFYAFREGKGKWAGRVFCNRFRSDYLDRVSAREQSFVREVIAADVEGTRKRFAEEIGCCWRCARTLTDAVSREHGIGPECRKALGL